MMWNYYYRKLKFTDVNQYLSTQIDCYCYHLFTGRYTSQPFNFKKTSKTLRNIIKKIFWQQTLSSKGRTKGEALLDFITGLKRIVLFRIIYFDRRKFVYTLSYSFLLLCILFTDWKSSKRSVNNKCC